MCRKSVCSRRFSLALLWLAFVPSLDAAIGISPMRVDVYAEPGGPSVSFDLGVLNTTDETRKVELQAEEFRIGNYGELLFEPELRARDGRNYKPTELSGAPFIHFLEPFFYLAPREERQIQCTVQLPVGAQGEYYAMVNADPGQMRPQNTYGAPREFRVTLQVSVMVFIFAGKRVVPKKEGDIVTFEPTVEPFYDVELADLQPIFPTTDDAHQTLKIRGRFGNRSNVHILADTTAELRSLDERRIVERFTFGQGATRLVFPTSERWFIEEVKSPLKPGNYRIEVEVDYGHPERPCRLAIPFRVETLIKGLPDETMGLGILAVESDRVATAGPPGKVVRQEITVYNRVDEQLKVSVSLVGESEYHDWVTFAPSRFTIAPGQERSFQIRVNIAREAFTDIRNLEVALEPKSVDGEGFPESETLRLTVVLRVQPPPTARAMAREGRLPPPSPR